MPVRVIEQTETDSLAAPNPTGIVPGVIEIVQADASISAAGDQDFYRVSVNAGQVITVRTLAGGEAGTFPQAGPFSNLDTVVSILNSAGTVVANSDDAD